MDIKDRDDESPSKLYMLRSKYADTVNHKEYITEILDSFSVSILQNSKKMKIVNWTFIYLDCNPIMLSFNGAT